MKRVLPLPRCRGDEFLSGRWESLSGRIHQPSAPPRAPDPPDPNSVEECCNQTAVNRRQHGFPSTWVLAARKCQSWTPRQMEYILNTHSLGSGRGWHSLFCCYSPPQPAQWIPSMCSLHKWNATDFCQLLGSRRIMMIGDSHMQQTALVVS